MLIKWGKIIHLFQKFSFIWSNKNGLFFPSLLPINCYETDFKCFTYININLFFNIIYMWVMLQTWSLVEVHCLKQPSPYKRTKSILLADKKGLHHLGQVVVWIILYYKYIIIKPNFNVKSIQIYFLGCKDWHKYYYLALNNLWGQDTLYLWTESCLMMCMIIWTNALQTTNPLIAWPLSEKS